MLGVPKILHPIALTLALAWPVSVFAQSPRDRDPALSQAKRLATEIQSANYHWGPFYLLSRFQLSDIGYGYDYNVPTGEESQGVAVSVAAPQRFFFVPRKKLIFTADVIPSYSMFFGGNARNQFDYDLRADAHLLLNHAYVDLYVLGADKLRSQPADYHRMATVKTSAFGANSEVKFSSRTSLLMNAERTSISFPGGERYQPDGVPIELLARDELFLRGALLHKTFPLTSFRIAAETADYNFDQAAYKNARRVRISPGFDYDGSRVDIRAEAGPTWLTHDDPSQEDLTGITGSVGITRSSRRWNMNLGGSRDVEFSVMEGNNYFVSNRLTAGIAYSANARLSLRANVTGERDIYPEPFHGVNRRDDITFSTLGFRYTRRRLTGGIDVGPYTRTSTLPGSDESGIRYVLELSFTP